MSKLSKDDEESWDTPEEVSEFGNSLGLNEEDITFIGCLIASNVPDQKTVKEVGQLVTERDGIPNKSPLLRTEVFPAILVVLSIADICFSFKDWNDSTALETHQSSLKRIIQTSLDYVKDNAETMSLVQKQLTNAKCNLTQAELDLEQAKFNQPKKIAERTQKVKDARQNVQDANQLMQTNKKIINKQWKKLFAQIEDIKKQVQEEKQRAVTQGRRHAVFAVVHGVAAWYGFSGWQDASVLQKTVTCGNVGCCAGHAAASIAWYVYSAECQTFFGKVQKNYYLMLHNHKELKARLKEIDSSLIA